MNPQRAAASDSLAVDGQRKRLVLRTRPQSGALASYVQEEMRPASYTTWSSAVEALRLNAALEAIGERGLSYRAASECYGIPLSTLHNHASGKIKLGVRSGPKPYLSDAEEKQLVSFVAESSAIGLPRTRSQVGQWELHGHEL